jgi:hypothetical protein
MTDAIITNVDLMVDPNEDTVHAVMSWLKANGHCVVVFTPDEIDGADTEVMQDRMINAGWNVIWGGDEARIIAII